MSPALPKLTAVSNISLSALEIELLQNVHQDYKDILVEKEFGGGYSGTRVFLVLPIKSNGDRVARLVSKTGPVSGLLREKENYVKHVDSDLPHNATQVKGWHQHNDQAALNYAFTGGSALGETISLEDYYLTQPSDTIKNTLRVLLENTLGEMWYGQSKPLNTFFRAEYQRHFPEDKKLDEIVKNIFPHLQITRDGRIQIPGIAGIFRDPLKTYPDLLDKTLDGRCSLVHGDLHLRNVLVDGSDRGWLIDFAKVETRHNIFDFIKLEVYIRFMALAKMFGSFSWNEYAQFEATLNAATVGQDSESPTNADLNKAYQVIKSIRQIAKIYMGAKHDFKKEYFPALLFYALSRLKYYPSADGPIPFQLIFITACSLAVDIFEERKIMITNSNEPDESEEKMSPKNEKAPRSGNVSIGGNARDNVVITGDQNTVGQVNRKVNTGGGAYVEGNVHVQGGDFVGRDKHVMQNNGTSVDEIARAFMMIQERASQEKEITKREDALEAVEKLKVEAERGEEAEESRVQRWFSFLAEASADAWDVAVITLSNPKLGLGTAFMKIVQRAKDTRMQRGRN